MDHPFKNLEKTTGKDSHHLLNLTIQFPFIKRFILRGKWEIQLEWLVVIGQQSLVVGFPFGFRIPAY